MHGDPRKLVYVYGKSNSGSNNTARREEDLWGQRQYIWRLLFILMDNICRLHS